MIYNIIYKTTNIINNKFYIGKHSTNNLDDGYLGTGTAIAAAIEKYGIENFKREILSYHNSSKEAYIVEAKIVTKEFVNRKDTYNMRSGGEGLPAGIECSNETREKMSCSHTGMTHSIETRKKIGRAHKGKKLSEHTKHLLREKRLKQPPPRLGAIISKEQRRKQSKAMKGFKHSIRTCPHCGRVGGGPNMTRYHFDNCKLCPVFGN